MVKAQWVKVGRVTLRGVAEMSRRQKRDTARWLQNAARDVLNVGQHFSRVHTATYNMRKDI